MSRNSDGKRLDTGTINSILGVDEEFKAPARMMEIMLDRPWRERVFRRMLAIDADVSRDWFRDWFQAGQADRRVNKQDLTPDSVGDLVSRFTEGSGSDGGWTAYDPTAGTGGMLIRKWWAGCMGHTLFDYRPHRFLYVAEELSDRALPFLLFNLVLRGMNAVVIHGDTLARRTKDVYLVENDMDDPLGFSSLNVFPRSKQPMRAFDIRSWEGDGVGPHAESPMFDRVAPHMGIGVRHE